MFDSQFKSDQPSPIKYKPVPYAMFTHPQIAGVGLTENDAKSAAVDVVIANAYISSAMGTALRSDHGFVKLLFERGSKRLVGAHIVGREASTMIHMYCLYGNAGYI